MKTIKHLYGISFLLLSMALTPAYGQFVEPEISDYTNHPIFHVQSQSPNIMVILDNSGSMNFSAYDDEYESPDEPSYITNRINSGYLCAEQYDYNDEPWTGSNSDLDMGAFNTDGSEKAYAGIRFTSVGVPQGRTINRAYIQLTSYRDLSGTCNLVVSAHDSDSAPYFNTNDRDNLRERFAPSRRTTAQTNWNVPAWTQNQRDNDTRVDVTSIVQEIVNRPGWARGNRMVFLIEGTGKRDAHRNNTYTPSRSPELFIDYEPEAGDDADFLYYGYFDSGTLDNETGAYIASRYSYDGSKFVRDPSGDWDGNWLNWCTMRRADVLRKVLVGGELYGTSGDAAITNTGEYGDERDFSRTFDDSAGVNTPYHGSYTYAVRDGKFYVDGDTYNIRVLKDPDLEPEEFDATETSLAGVLQNVGNKARWGNMWFDYSNGGWLDNRIASSNVDNVIDDVRDKTCNTWTPLAETYLTAMEYFQQDSSPTYSGRYNVDTTDDPYVTDDGDEIFCAKSFVILLTDGASTQDQNVPSDYTDTDSDTNETDRTFSSDGTDYLDDLAYYSHINDLRPDLEGTQNLSLYVVYAFDDDPDARALLKDAAINGGFEDMDNDSKPDIMLDPRGGEWADIGHNEEWDKNADGVPDNYWEADDGFKLKSSLEKAINEILKTAASGTSVSVLATRGEGEGTLTQAFFKPALPIEGSTEDIRWLGYLQMLWIDSFGHVREDSTSDKILDISQDNVVRFFLDSATGENMVYRYSPSESYPYPYDNATWVAAKLETLSPLWEAGEILSNRTANTRVVFTHTIDNSTDNSTWVDFNLSNESTLTPYLAVEDDATWGAAGAKLGTAESDRVQNIINFVLGEPANQGNPTIRSRTTEEGDIWRLGDIVYSTPVTVSRPVENYGLIYDDTSYWEYYTKYADRETVVYVGANDGMLHAFSAGVYNVEDMNNPIFEAADDNATSIVGTIGIGDEMWGFIPNSLLPHLKWLPQFEYTHIPYVDLKVRITDARIFPDDDTHPNRWGTVLIGGLNFGGKEIETQNAGTFTPSIFALDVTNPRDPKILWEKSQESLPNLGFTTNTPAFIRAGEDTSGNGNNWMLALSSGPTNYDFNETTGELTVSSDQNAHVYILDLKTGTLLKDFGGSGATYANSYMTSPVSFDKNLNYNVDAIYMGTTYDDNGTNKGAIYKITVPQTGGTFIPYADDTAYDGDPDNWNFKLLADSPAPITAPLLLSIDRLHNTWLFGGTGKYMDEPDKADDAQNYLFGIKDPFFNKDKYSGSGYWDYSGEQSISAISLSPAGNQLFIADSYTVTTDPETNEVTGDDSSITNFSQLLAAARSDAYDGWIRSLCPGAISDTGVCTSTGPSERLLNKQAILGGILLSPTFSPNADICGYGGVGRLWALYYETGTAWKRQVFGDIVTLEIEDVVFLGSGLTSSFGIHVGRQKGGTVFGQMSTGVIQRIDIDPAFEQKSQPTYWQDYLE